MGTNILFGKQVSFEKIVMGPCVSSQYKKDKHCEPVRTQLPTNVMQVH
jgi:hypothetical protein